MSLAQPLGLQVACFKTSIWDETLYRAWSTMVYSLIPNRDHLQSHLEKLCAVCRADELVLFERATFLVISNAVMRPHADVRAAAAPPSLQARTCTHAHAHAHANTRRPPRTAQGLPL